MPIDIMPVKYIRISYNMQKSSVLQQFGIVLPTPQNQQGDGEEKNRQVSRSIDPMIRPIPVFLDGSAIGNGKKTVKAGYAAVFPDHPHLTLHEHLPWQHGVKPTNNRAEYMALIRAHEVAPPGVTLKAYTDSMLLLKTVTEWIPSWKRKGWKKADGSPLLNVDLVKRIDQLKTERIVTMQHVRAHTGKTDYYSTWNNEADKLAKAAATMAK